MCCVVEECGGGRGYARLAVGPFRRYWTLSDNVNPLPLNQPHETLCLSGGGSWRWDCVGRSGVCLGGRGENVEQREPVVYVFDNFFSSGPEQTSVQVS